jgi:hypothetical protein
MLKIDIAEKPMWQSRETTETHLKCENKKLEGVSTEPGRKNETHRTNAGENEAAEGGAWLTRAGKVAGKWRRVAARGGASGSEVTDKGGQSDSDHGGGARVSVSVSEEQKLRPSRQGKKKKGFKF